VPSLVQRTADKMAAKKINLNYQSKEEKELQQCTFKPSLNKPKNNAKGKIMDWMNSDYHCVH
jgi:hypothetical protein